MQNAGFSRQKIIRASDKYSLQLPGLNSSALLQISGVQFFSPHYQIWKIDILIPDKDLDAPTKKFYFTLRTNNIPPRPR